MDKIANEACFARKRRFELLSLLPAASERQYKVRQVGEVTSLYLNNPNLQDLIRQNQNHIAGASNTIAEIKQQLEKERQEEAAKARSSTIPKVEVSPNNSPKRTLNIATTKEEKVSHGNLQIDITPTKTSATLSDKQPVPEAEKLKGSEVPVNSANDREKVNTPSFTVVKHEDEICKIKAACKLYRERDVKVKQFEGEKKFKKFINHVKSQITMVSETVQSLMKKYYGNNKILGPKTFLDKAEKVIPDKMDLVYHVIAKHMIVVASSSTTPDSLKFGCTKYALVYMAIAICVERPDFYDHLVQALHVACPFTYPGLLESYMMDDLSTEELQVAIGRKANETTADYLSRMQAIVAWQAAFMQTRMTFLEFDIEKPLINPGSSHPCQNGPMIFLWRWLAGHLNGHISRWTPYILQAFLAVAGHEMCNQIGVRQMRKIIKVLSSSGFRDKCKKMGNFDTKEAQNDKDRFSAFVEYFDEISKRPNEAMFNPPGKPGEDDARLLHFDTVQNYS